MKLGVSYESWGGGVLTPEGCRKLPGLSKFGTLVAFGQRR